MMRTSPPWARAPTASSSSPPTNWPSTNTTPHYYGDKPFFDRIILKGGGEALSAAKSVLDEGEADYAWNLQIDPDTLVQDWRPLAMARSSPRSQASWSASSSTRPTTTPPSAKTAPSTWTAQIPIPSFPSPQSPRPCPCPSTAGLISERLYGFAGEPTCNLIVGPPSYVSTANDGCLAQDIGAANQLLDDNGVIDSDGDGVREYNGIPLRITFQTSTNDIRQETQFLVQDWWGQIGIETEIIHHDAAVYFGGDPVADKDAVYSRFFADVQMYASGPDIDPQQYLVGLTCEEIPDRDNNWGGGNVARACNPEFDELVEELAHTPIGPDRDALVRRMNDIQVQAYYEIPLVNRGIVSAHSDTLKGVRINGWDSELWNIAEWRR